METLTLRPAIPDDKAFMCALYRTSRDYDLAYLGHFSDEEQFQFLDSQFAAQYASYRRTYPDAVWSIFEQNGEPIGRLIVDYRSEEVGLMDISFLPAYRGLGYGTTWVRRVMHEGVARKQPVRLYVTIINSGALRLYERLGFRISSASETHYHMEWLPS